MKQLYSLLGIVALLLWTCLPSQAITQLMKQNATDKIEFLLTDASTGQIGQTGQAANVVIKVSKASGVGAASAGTITEKDGLNFPGVYLYTPAAAETNLIGILGLHVTCAGCTTQDYAVQVYDPAQFGSSLPSTYPLSASDELLLTYLLNMVDPNAGTPRYKATSLALAPTGAGGASGDPWATPLPGTYAAGTAGYVLSNLLPSIFAQPVENGLTFLQAQRLQSAYVGGNTDVVNHSYKAAGNPTITRMTYGLDASGNRTITLTLQ